MKVAVYSAKPYDRQYLEAAGSEHEFVFLEPRLNVSTAPLARGASAVCCFVNDCLDAAALEALHAEGVRYIALRCAGYNQVDLAAARRLGLGVARVPAYSPHAVAEHAVGLILNLNRNIHRAFNRIRENDYSLHGLLGFDLYGKTVGAIGGGAIGRVFCRIMAGFGCRVLLSDPAPSDEARAVAELVELDQLLAESDIVSLHCPLTPATYHLIDAARLNAMRRGAMLINTSRGALIDTRAVIAALKSGQLGYLGIDVYEEEEALFFEDQSNQPLQDDVFARLITFPNVLITGHQGFFTREALTEIARVTVANLDAFASGENRANERLC